LGHQHLGIISGPFGSTHPKILALNHGVSEACENLGLPIEAQHIVYGDLSEHAGRTALEEILARQPAPTAIFAMSDRAALGALYLAHARGLKVPGDLSIIGCSGDPSAAAVDPPLTTIHIPAEEVPALPKTRKSKSSRCASLFAHPRVRQTLKKKFNQGRFVP
jgi:LacI family transcriptional regulator